MSCSSCSNNSSGVPNGCKSNGNCGTGGCETMSVFDWLSDVQVPTGRSIFDVVEVSFKNGRKGFFRNEKNIQIFKGDSIVVEASPGHDVGVVSLTGELVKHQMNRKGAKMAPHELRKVYRKTTEADFDKWKAARDKEYETMHEARELIVKLGLKMKLGDVEYQGDGNKATFYYTADQRVDFRELIKVMAEQFRIKIEMRQIGSRQEAGRLGGIGSCGRELCCSTWLNDFRSVSTGAARYQQLSLNPQKLAGQCGKLKCCLNFELDQYAEELKSFPDTRKPLETAKGTAVHIKTDVFKRLMWYLVRGEKNSSIICLTVDRVFELIEMNKKGTKISNITDYVQVEEPKNEVEYANVDDQDDLTRFDNKFNKKKNNRNKSRNKKRNNPNASGGNQNNQKKSGAPKGENKKAPEGSNPNPNKSSNNKRRNKNYKKKNKPNTGSGNTPNNSTKPKD
jgi:cell fate regulator YaaT (PSP1 superfamily)